MKGAGEGEYGVKAIAFAGVALVGLLAATALSGPPSPVKISGSVGGPAIVEGVVSEVHVAARSGVTFIDLGGRYPGNTFTAVIWPEDAAKFPHVGELYGRMMKITGPLQLYQGKQEIILRDAGQLETE